MTTRFNELLQKFPAVKLPVSITEDTASEYGTANSPLSERLISDHILPLEGMEEMDEMTEFVPCFRIDGTKDFHALVYWKAGLMNYQYVMATFGKGGKAIDRQVVAGTFSDGRAITRSVAKIDEDMTIYIVSGQTDGGEEDYDANLSTAREIELMPDGRMVELG